MTELPLAAAAGAAGPLGATGAAGAFGATGASGAFGALSLAGASVPTTTCDGAGGVPTPGPDALC